MKRICVYCGASRGSDPAYAEGARAFGELLAQRGMTVVFGGGRVGLMGVLADAALAAGGEVIGVMPHALVARETAHTGLTQLHIVNSMHERKAMLAGLADGFIAMPGGVGTLEELFETWTWAQLGVHGKPIGLLDIAGYWQPLVTFLDHMSGEGFLRPFTRELVLVDADAERLLARMVAHVAAAVTPWVSMPQI
jgi:uncharacterized protein (TIGR00730 family)